MKCIQFESILTDNAEYALLMDALKKKIAYCTPTEKNDDKQCNKITDSIRNQKISFIIFDNVLNKKDNEVKKQRKKI